MWEKSVLGCISSATPICHMSCICHMSIRNKGGKDINVTNKQSISGLEGIIALHLLIFFHISSFRICHQQRTTFLHPHLL